MLGSQVTLYMDNLTCHRWQGENIELGSAAST